MPGKRLSPSSETSDAAELPLKRTHRTHEENQERAYIAASRRADRDIEHRIRSALKASECRKKRTGRGLKITREAVMGDEQYESEDDDPTTRRFSMPAPSSMPTNPYVAQQNRADRYAEVDALFAKHFPHVQLSSRWAAPQTHTHTHSHRHSYPQVLQQLQTAFIPPYHHPDTASAAAAAATTHASSPLLTPPISYPLPPNRDVDDTKAGSMSPLALSSSHSRPGSTVQQQQQQAPFDLGIDLTDSGAAEAGLMLNNNEVDDGGDDGLSQQNQQPFQDAYLSWFGASENLPSGGAGGGFHSRSLSLPSSLAQFQFPFETTAATAAGELALVDPSILQGAVSTALAADGGVTTVTPPNEPWADWINLDGGDVQPAQAQVQPLGQAVGVKV